MKEDKKEEPFFFYNLIPLSKISSTVGTSQSFFFDVLLYRIELQ